MPALDRLLPLDDVLDWDVREAMAAFVDPSSLTMRSLVFADPPLDFGDPRTLTTPIPAVNGVCTARSLARLYAGLIGEVDGVRLLAPETLDAATVEQAYGPDLVLRMPTRPALGFGLPLPGMAWEAPHAFGFAGHGGSLGYADRDTGIAFGYVMNRLHVAPAPDPRASRLVTAVRECVAGLP